MKYKIIIILVLSLVLFIPCTTAQPNYTPDLTPFEENIATWGLGDEIVPYPYYDKLHDCDDGVVYSYLYLLALQEDYEIKIMHGICDIFPGNKKHVWLDVSDNSSRYIYEMGFPLLNFELYHGKEISYGKLLQYAYWDTIS